MNQIIVINGLGGSGKSTFIQCCEEVVINNHYNVTVNELSTVDYVKIVAKAVGWTGGKTAADRIFLSDLKKAFAKWNDKPLQTVYENIQKIVINEEWDHLIFINSREPEDIRKIKTYAQEHGYGFCVIMVHKPDVMINEVPELIDQILNMAYDYIIENTGNLEELYTTAETFVYGLIKGDKDESKKV